MAHITTTTTEDSHRTRSPHRRLGTSSVDTGVYSTGHTAKVDAFATVSDMVIYNTGLPNVVVAT